MTLEELLERLLFVAIAVLACLMPAQNDTWWHLRAGYLMLDTGTVLLRDVFSHTVSGDAWPNYEWLTQVIFALVHRTGGLPLLTGVCAAASVGGLWFVHASIPGTRMERIVVLAAVVSGVTITWSLRPQAFSLLLLGATLWLVRRRVWVPLPVLFLIWANLHGAVALGVVVLVGALTGYLIHERRVPPGLTAAAVLSGFATLATPLGLSYWYEIAVSIARSRANEIAEWRAPEWPPSHLAFWAIAIGLPLLAIARRRRLRTPEDWGALCTALLMLPLALRSMRNISPFLMAAAPAVGTLLADRRIERADHVGRSRAVVHAVGLGAAILAGVLIVQHAWRHPPARMGWHPMSVAAAQAIERCPGPLYNSYIDGGPIIFFAPRQPVLLDSRQDPYPVALVQAEGEVQRSGQYEELFDRYGIRCAAVPPSATLRGRLEGDGWIRRFADDQWAVLERPSSGGSGLK